MATKNRQIFNSGGKLMANPNSYAGITRIRCYGRRLFGHPLSLA